MIAPFPPETFTESARERQATIWATPEWARAFGCYCKLCGGTTLHWSDCPEFLLIQKLRRASSLRPFYTWLAIALLVGAVLGAVGSTVFLLTSAVELTAARAAHGQMDAIQPIELAQQSEPARANPSTATVDVLPASAADTSGATTHQPDAFAPHGDAAPARGDLTPAASTPRGQPASRSFIRTSEQVIRAAAAEFGIDPDAHVALSMCESSLNALAVGKAGEIGPFQFKAATFAWFARDSGLGYDLRSIGDPRAQARVAAWAVANGYASHWTCAR